MYNPCVTSTLSIRYKSPFNNNCSYFPDYRNNLISSHSCCCLCCSPNYVYTNLINPTFLCGSRQSSLIHFSASRRVLIFLRPDPRRKCCCGYVKERGFRQEVGRSLGERKFRRMVSERRSCDFENAEMMLSLLGEEERYVRERDCSALMRVKFKTKGSDSDRFLRDIKENVGSRANYEASRIYSSENEAKSRRKEGKTSKHEEHLRGVKRRGRKSGSSCSSSYYTCSSLGENTESDNEIHHRNDACMEESGEVFKRERKESGNVVYEGEVKENLRKHENVVGTHKIMESDWRKKSEKKLDEVVIGEVCGTSDNRGSSSHKQFDTVDNMSKSFISESGTRQQNSRRSDQVIGGLESTRNQKQFMEDDVDGISSSRNRFSGREEKSTVAGSFVLGKKHEHLETDNRVNRRDDYRFSTEQSNQVSQLEDINVKRSNITQSQEDKVKRQEDRYSVVPSSVQDTVKHYYLESEEDSRKMDSRRKFQQSSEISDDGVSRRDDYRSSQESQIQDMNVRRTKISRAQYEDKVKRREDQSAVISSSVQDTGSHYYSKSEEDLTQMDSREKFRQSAEISDDRVSRRDDDRLHTEQSDEVSQIQDTNVRRTNISRAQYEDKAKRREDLSLVISSSVQDTENRYYLQREDDLRQMDLRRKSQQSTETSAAQTQYVLSGQQVSKKVSTKGSLDISTVTLGQTSDTQNANIHKTSEDRISSGETYTSMFGKSTEERKRRTETSDNRVLRFESTKEAGGTSHKASSLQASLVLETIPSVGDGSNSQANVMTPISQFPITSSQGGSDRDALYTSTEINAPSSTVTQTQINDDPLTSISHEDALGSALRFQKSSSKIVGEFLEKVTHEASTSHHQLEKSTSKDEMLIKGYKHEDKSSSEYADVDFKLKDQGSRRSFGSSGVKGHSDEIWDEVAPSTREPVDSPTHVPETTSLSQSIVVKRTGRSLWNVFSDIVRLPWSSRLKTSTPKLGVRNSPNQSSKSEAWFSSHDQEETSDENMKRRNKNMSRESIPTLTQYQGEGYSSSSSKDKISPSKTPIGSTTPKGSSSVSTEENFKMGGSTMMETSVSVPSLRIRRSPNVEEVTEVDNRTISASGSLAGKEEQVTISSPIIVKGSEAKVGGDLKRRMLQRTNQVIKDRFDEWEEAFTLESEQRKIDEAFMREALLEAKKAGDMWEVPVGAVLVQYGKIIARGYNLVEELRDSTAHAEMICIREGSNQLRTWRLADTTLYVTLEPCPMCAGAILQARVDTVVWGAPNKLLGADGSWIRLFPGGGEGGTSSESPDKPPAPVHPFHPKIVIRRGVLETECADVMRQFFQLRRRKKDNKQLPDPPTPPSRLPISNHPTKILNRMQDAFHFMFCL